MKPVSSVGRGGIAATVETIPSGNGAVLLRDGAVPMGNGAVPTGIEAVPIGIEAVPIGIEAVPIGNIAVPLGNGGREPEANGLGGRPRPVGWAKLPLFDRGGNGGPPVGIGGGWPLRAGKAVGAEKGAAAAMAASAEMIIEAFMM